MTRTKDNSESIELRQSLIFLSKERSLTIQDTLVAASLLAQKRPGKGTITQNFGNLGGLLSTFAAHNSITRLVSAGLIKPISRFSDNHDYDVAPLEEALSRFVVPQWQPEVKLPKKTYELALERYNRHMRNAATTRETQPMVAYLMSSYAYCTWHRCEKDWTKIDLSSVSPDFDIEYEIALRHSKWCLCDFYPESSINYLIDGRKFQKLNGEWHEF
jgi:hypothetical protein